MADKPLHTGDIVITYSVDKFGVSYISGMTVVVSDQYQTYNDGSEDGKHVEKEGDLDFFVMGIRSVDLGNDTMWKVLKIKGFESVINGEHWPDYGFCYREDSLHTEEGRTEWMTP